jgi:hypothetical protein
LKNLKRKAHAGFFVLGWVAACAPQTVQPTTTADQILGAQYRARTSPGVLSGKEAQSIVDQYQQHIGAKPAETSDTTDSKQ